MMFCIVSARNKDIRNTTEAQLEVTDSEAISVEDSDDCDDIISVTSSDADGDEIAMLVGRSSSELF